MKKTKPMSAADDVSSLSMSNGHSAPCGAGLQSGPLRREDGHMRRERWSSGTMELRWLAIVALTWLALINSSLRHLS